MKVEDIKTLHDCGNFLDNLLTDLLSGTISRFDAMALLGKYTAHINNLDIIVDNE